MYGATFKKVHRPDDDQFYCVMLPDEKTALGHHLPGKVAPERGSFEDMVTAAHRILASQPEVAQVHVNHSGNFWHRVKR